MARRDDVIEGCRLRNIKLDGTLSLTDVQLQQLLRISRTAFYRMRRAGNVPRSWQLSGRRRYHVDAIAMWLDTKLVHDAPSEPLKRTK